MPELIDQFSRKIDYLRISITDRCNLRCRYCISPQGVRHIPRKEILTYEEILRIAKIASNCEVTKIRVTGGEPLIRRGAPFFLEELNKLSSIQDITLTTNGLLLSRLAEDIHRAGVKRVNISLDTLKADKYRFITNRDAFDQVWAGIKAAKEAGFSPIKINFVVIKGFNDDEIIDFARLTLQNPYQVRFIEFMPFGVKDYWSTDKIVKAHHIMKELSQTFTLEPITHPLNKEGTAHLFKLSGGQGEIGFITPYSQHFCGRCNRIRLTSDGKLRNCLFSDREIDLKKALRTGAQDRELEEILLDSIRQKPPGHKLHEDISFKCKRSVWEIGG